MRQNVEEDEGDVGWVTDGSGADVRQIPNP